ncbi:MAG TPA: zinc-binding dehydrogenase [Acidimicrobiia bacterium]
MRAAIARAGTLVVDEVAEPEPGDGHALVAVRACGICGSDLHTLRHAHRMVDVAEATGMGGAFDPDADFVMGHEYVAEVLELGPATDGVAVRPGDLVVSIPFLIAGADLVPLGFSNDYPGAYAERMLLTAGACLPVPNGLDARRAALTEPMAVGLHAVNKSGIERGCAAAVVGCGPIGLAIVAWLGARGIEPIVASDLSRRRRALAVELGAHVVVDPRDEPVFEAWRRVDGMRSLVVYEAVGVPGVLDEVIFAAPSQARVLVAGVCMEPDTVRPLIAVVKEINLQFAFGYDPAEFADTLRAIAEGEIDVTPFLTGSVGLDGVAAAFDALADPEGHVKILVEPGTPPGVTPLGDTHPAR